MNLTSLIPKSLVKKILIALLGMAAIWGNKGILSQKGKEIDLGYGAKLVITQDMCDKGTNAVELARLKAIEAIENNLK